MGSHIPLFRVSYPPYALVLALCYAFMQLTFLQHSMFCYALVVSSLSRVDTRMIIKTIVYIFHYITSQTTLHIYQRQTSSWSKLEIEKEREKK
ncbi:hypothetical protein EDD16DRAFT_254435 [Pisolithus croceorrhizus]|nr:hypothetical protein EDD16DRAFT_254435 [Pisolithus croceorrhizus]